MGMFDYVNISMDCPNCGREVDGFQSKDNECILATIEISQVNRFYTSCKFCGEWIEYRRKKPQVPNLDDFERVKGE